MGRSQANIRTRLIAILLLAVLPPFTLLLFHAAADNRRETETAHREAEVLVRILAADYANLIERSRGLTSALAESAAVKSRDRARIRQLMADTRIGNPQYVNLGVVDARGRLLAASIPTSAPIDYHERAWFHRVARGEFAVGDFIWGTLSRTPIVTFASPYKDEHGRFRRATYAAVSTQELQRRLDEADLPEGAVALLLDSNGTVLARTQGSEAMVGRRLSNAELLRHVASGRQGTLKTRDSDGRHRFYAYAPAYHGNGSILLAVGFDASGIAAATGKQLRESLLLLGLAEAVALLAATYASNRFVRRPLETLTHAATRLADGDLVSRVRLPHSSDEFSRLGDGFNQMASSIQAKVDELDAIIDSMAEPVFVLDGNGVFRRINSAFVELLDENPIDEPFVEFRDRHSLRVAGSPHSLPPAIRSLHGETVVREHVELRVARGPLHVLTSSAPLFDDDGRPAGAVVVWTDVTEDVQRTRLNDALNRLRLQMRAEAGKDPLLASTAREIASVLGCVSTAIGVREGDEWVALATWGLRPEIAGKTFKSEEIPFALEAIRTRDLVVVEDARNDPRLSPGLADDVGAGSTCVVPLVIGGTTTGLLFLNFAEGPRSFSEPERDFARKLGANLALALENAELYESVQRELVRTKALRELAAATTRAASISEVYATVTDVASDVLGAIAASLHVIEDGMLRLAAQRGLPDCLMTQRLPLGSDTGTRVVEEKAVFTHEDGSLPEPVVTVLRDEGLEDIRWVCLPLQIRGQVLGVLSLMFLGKRPFAEDELSLYRAMTEQLSVAVERARLYEAEHRVADTLQHALLSLPKRVSGLEIAHLYEGASEEALVGGDFYDVFEISRDQVALLVGDVSGKGLEAASLTALVKNGVRAHALEGHRPHRVIEKTNDMVARFTSVEVFVTAFFGVLDRRTGDLHYTVAGHPPPLVLRGDGPVFALPGNNPIIGAFAGVDFKDCCVELRPHDTLLLYTDGVIETRRDGGVFGEDRLLRAARELAGMAPEEVAQRVFEAVRQYAGGHLQDDLAIVAVRVKPRSTRDRHPYQERMRFPEADPLTESPVPRGEGTAGRRAG